MTAAFDDRLAALVDESLASLERLAGGAALCTFSRAGRPVPALKYAEGQWAAVREAHRRSVRGEVPPVDSAAQVLADWHRELRAVVERGAGPDWVAYRSGGVDAVSTLLGEADPTAPTLG